MSGRLTSSDLLPVVIAEPRPAAGARVVMLSPPVTVRMAEIRVELERVCTGCGGSAYVPVVIEERCRSCHGSGCEDLDAGDVCGACEGRCALDVEAMEQCERCDGSGVMLTPEGRRLLIEAGAELWRFLRRWRAS